MYYTLNRTENGNIAVLIDSDKNIHDVDISLLKPDAKIGNIYIFDGTHYIYNEKETLARKKSASFRLKNILSKVKNQTGG